MLDDLGLVAAVDWQIKGFRSRHDIDVQFTHEGIDGRLPPDLEIAAYRIIQEALTNVAKHAGAAVCSVTLSRQAGVRGSVWSACGSARPSSAAQW
jgi:signal transduction histidine kinase